MALTPSDGTISRLALALTVALSMAPAAQARLLPVVGAEDPAPPARAEVPPGCPDPLVDEQVRAWCTERRAPDPFDSNRSAAVAYDALRCFPDSARRPEYLQHLVRFQFTNTLPAAFAVSPDDTARAALREDLRILPEILRFAPEQEGGPTRFALPSTYAELKRRMEEANLAGRKRVLSEGIADRCLARFASDQPPRRMAAFRYKSRSTGGFQRRGSLGLLFVPGELDVPARPYDRWVQFNLEPDATGDLLNPPIPAGDALDPSAIQTVLAYPPCGETGARYLMVHYRGSDRNASVPALQTDRPDVSAFPGSTCVGCHPNGMRVPSPAGYGELRTAAELAEAPEALEDLLPQTPYPPGPDLEAYEYMRDVMAGYGPPFTGDVAVPGRPGERAYIGHYWHAHPPLGPLPLTEPDPDRPGAESAIGLAAERFQRLPPPREDGTYDLRVPNEILSLTPEAAARLEPGAAPTLDDLTGCAVSERTRRASYLYGADPEFSLRQRPRIDPGKVVAAMQCAQCHNGVVRSSLTVDTNDTELAIKVLLDRSMPPTFAGPALTDDERIALLNCLLAQDEILHRSWIEAMSCESPPASPAVAAAGRRPGCREPGRLARAWTGFTGSLRALMGFPTRTLASSSCP